MAKGEKDLVEQGRGSSQRLRASAAKLIEPGFLSMPAKVNAKKRTQPGDAQQVNDAQKNMQNGSPSAQPTPFARGGKVGAKCMACGGAAHKGMCAGGKMAVGGKAGHDDEAQDKKLFRKMFKQEEATETKGMKDGGKKNWIAGAVKKPGALHRELGVPQGQKIPKSKINAAANSSNPTLARRANFAKTVSKFAEGGSSSGSKQGSDDGSPPPKAPDRKGQKWFTGDTGKDSDAAKAVLDDARAKGQLDMKRGGRTQRFAVGGVAKIRKHVADKSGHAIAQPTKTSPAWK